MALMGILPMNAQVNFDDYFTPKTMRLDYYHAGDAKSEHFFVDEVIEEPYWAGNKNYLVDERTMGNHIFKVLDKASGKVIYSRGYSTLFNEWQATPEAKTTSKAMPEGVTFPYPKNDVIVEFYTRENSTGKYHKKFAYEIDVDSYFVRKAKPNLNTIDVHYTGNPAKRVDIVLISEGYTEAEKQKFVDACKIFAEGFFSYYPYSVNKDKFNIRAVWAPSAESGISIPGEYLWRNTALKTHYYTFDSERYQMIEDYQSILDVAANVPYEMIYILTNSQKYGGGGIYNSYTLTTAHHRDFRPVVVHEFGHSFAGLGDEYFYDNADDNDNMHSLKHEPWEPNITTMVDFNSKWADMIAEGIEIPTAVTPERTANYVVGAYEGGGYLSKGIYRPTDVCRMRNNTAERFCPVCERAIERVILHQAK